MSTRLLVVFPILLIAPCFSCVNSALADDDLWTEQLPKVQPSVIAGKGEAAAERDAFHVLPGFQVELLYDVPRDTHGSWVSIAFDKKGRLIASDQNKLGLSRVTPSPIGSSEPTKVERLNANVTAAQGMLYVSDSLYLSVNGGPGSGLYRARDTNGDDQYDEIELLKKLAGGGEHGPHALRLAPDGKSIFIVAGNHTNLPDELTGSRVPTNWDEDLLLPRQWDARGHARGKLAPGGWIASTDLEGQRWTPYSTGYRNAYDFAINADGELFAYDADMEWDMGTPWYRPTRVVHATSGSEFGWRSGTGKWPTYYVDSLPPVIETGPGSPVGVEFGYGAKFPAKYQRALYILDWTFGTIYAIHLKPEGASYTAEKEEFVSRTPLPLTDAAIGPDGALYFTIGGRGVQSALYRVTYVGDESTAPANSKNEAHADLRALRRRLEAFHGRADPAAVDAVWPHLGHEDRFIRFAARIALEAQPVDQWQERALAERDPGAKITAAVALARQGDESLRPRLLESLWQIDFNSLSEQQQLEWLRAVQLVCIRMGRPDAQTAAEIASRLDKHYPADSDDLNRELCNLLVYFRSPMVITKTLALMEQSSRHDAKELEALIARNDRYGGSIKQMLANMPELQNLHYALALRNLRYGWTLDQRRAYFAFLNRAATWSGGASYRGFVDNIRKEALANLSPAEQKALESETAPPPVDLTKLPKPKGPGREWTVAEVIALADAGLQGRSFKNGRRTFVAARCAACHRFDGDGGATGPDLSNLAGRFGVREIVEALVEPSKVISDQYRGSIIRTVAGEVITGRILGEDDDELQVLTDPFDATKVVAVRKDDVEEMKPAPLSEMPTGLMHVLNEGEVLDLMAYLLSRGNPEDAMFAP